MSRRINQRIPGGLSVFFSLAMTQNSCVFDNSRAVRISRPLLIAARYRHHPTTENLDQEAIASQGIVPTLRGLFVP
jgi:hypothetical protein